MRLEVPANTPSCCCGRPEGRRRVLPDLHRQPEAAAIHYALEGIVPPRPLTHDLLVNVLEELAPPLERVVVTEVATTRSTPSCTS